MTPNPPCHRRHLVVCGVNGRCNSHRIEPMLSWGSLWMLQFVRRVVVFIRVVVLSLVSLPMLRLPTILIATFGLSLLTLQCWRQYLVSEHHDATHQQSALFGLHAQRNCLRLPPPSLQTLAYRSKYIDCRAHNYMLQQLFETYVTDKYNNRN